jgi:hypothetical protein
MRKKASVSSRSTVSSASGHSGHPRPLDGRGILVVVELGGEWPSEAAIGCSPSSTPLARRVLAQAEGETPAAFAERVASSLDSLFGRGIQLETVVLACNERLDESAEAARRKALGLALGSMAKHKCGRAYLAAAGRSSGRLRHALSALAQGLFDEWRTAGLEVSVDFGDESRLADAAQPQFVFTARVA